MFVARFKRADSVVLLEVNQQPRTTLEGDIFDSPWRFIAAAPSSLSRPRTSCANLSRDATPLRSLAEPCPEPPCAALCLPLFPSLSPESSFHANMATATSTAFHAVARRLPRSKLVLHRPEWREERGEGRKTLRTGQRQRTESQAIIVRRHGTRRPRTPALAQLHSMQSQNGGVRTKSGVP